ncbi:MAG: mechanosensitive ion channel family protein [bacterium]
MLEDFANQSFYNNSVHEWLIGLGLAALVLVIAQIVRSMAVARLGRLARRTTNLLDDALVAALKRTKLYLVAIGCMYVGSLILTFSDRATSFRDAVVFTALLVQAAIWGTAIIDFAIDQVRADRREKDPAAASVFSVLSFFARLILWCLVAFLVLDQVGIDITTFVAGLGIGGIAVALALQNILGDIFCSVAILMDKPFEVGDFIVVGDMLGTVEKIGIKTTRVRALSGEQLVFSNADLVSSRVRNYKRMQERRVLFSFGVLYQTPADKLERIPEMVKQIVDSNHELRFDRAHFKSFGKSSLDFECVYYVLSADYNLFMDFQQAINLSLYRRLEENGIEFAYPTRTVFVHQEATKPG